MFQPSRASSSVLMTVNRFSMMMGVLRYVLVHLRFILGCRSYEHNGLCHGQSLSLGS